MVEQFRRTNDHLLHRRVLAIENTQRIRVETTFCFFIEQIDVFFEISNQLCTMTSAFVQLPKRIQLQLDAVQSKVIPKTGAHQNLLGVNIGAGIAEGLDADLIELAITPFLRPLMAEHLPHVVQTLWMLRCQLVLNDRTHATGRALRTQSQRLAIQAVDEGIHLFFDDVSHFADGALKKRSRLDNRQTNRPVAIALQPRAHGFFKNFPKLRFPRQDVVHPADGLNIITHDIDAFFLR